MRSIFSRALLVLAVALPAWAEGEDAGPKVVEQGSQVSIEYTLKLDDGSEADGNVGGAPLVYRQGGSQILPALEAELAGLKVNETRHVTLTPEQGYGVSNPELFQEVELERIPEDARKVGARLVSEDTSGNRRLVRVHEVKDEKVVLDFNHPLAGETLHFDVKIVAIE